MTGPARSSWQKLNSLSTKGSITSATVSVDSFSMLHEQFCPGALHDQGVQVPDPLDRHPGEAAGGIRKAKDKNQRLEGEYTDY